jgi:hypothetical protein
MFTITEMAYRFKVMYALDNTWNIISGGETNNNEKEKRTGINTWFNQNFFGEEMTYANDQYPVIFTKLKPDINMGNFEHNPKNFCKSKKKKKFGFTTDMIRTFTLIATPDCDKGYIQIKQQGVLKLCCKAKNK